MIRSATQSQTTPRWMMVDCSESSDASRVLALQHQSVTVGRSPQATITLNSATVSKLHAELDPGSDGVLVTDLGSTNGTFINGTRIHSPRLARVGDLIQFATHVYRLEGSPGPCDSHCSNTITDEDLAWTRKLMLFDRMMSERLVAPHFQQIVWLGNRQPLAYEVLARGGIEGLVDPYSIFKIAAKVGQEEAFSELMRVLAIERVSREVTPPTLFLNTHPSETATERLIRSLEQLRRLAPTLSIAIEVHEGGVTQVAEMRKLRAALDRLDMRLAYDDFGAGQARLLELTEVPPDVLKFDRGLIKDLDTASKPRLDIVRGLVEVARSMGIVTLAEGVETEAEHEVCVELGFQQGQGYLYGRPSPELQPA